MPSASLPAAALVLQRSQTMGRPTMSALPGDVSMLNGEWSGHTPQILATVILWVALPVAAGLVRTVRREIN